MDYSEVGPWCSNTQDHHQILTAPKLLGPRDASSPINSTVGWGKGSVGTSSHTAMPPWEAQKPADRSREKGRESKRKRDTETPTIAGLPLRFQDSLPLYRPCVPGLTAQVLWPDVAINFPYTCAVTQYRGNITRAQCGEATWF